MNPLPLPSEQEFVKSLEQAKQPDSTEEKERLQKEMGFNYRQLIGEEIWSNGQVPT